MNMITPPKNQGQIVETSYGWHDGCLYRRIVDRSDGSVIWEMADEDESDHLPEGWCAVNGSPTVDSWTPCNAPDGDR